MLIATAAPAFAQAQLVKGEATLSAGGGYARLVLKLDEDVESDVVVAGSVLVIRFKRPVYVPIDKLADAVPDYVGSARRDPDGGAIRLALQRKVTVNSMAAGERLYVDLLPDDWKGAPPGLPQDVLKELSDRARAAEKALRAQRAALAGKARPPVRVRAAVQPTFVRYVFEMPDGVTVNSTLSDQKLSLLFTAPLSFDLADAKLAAPPNISSIGQTNDADRSAVEIGLIGNVDVHSFREEKNYIVDIGFQQPEPAQSLPAAIARLQSAVRASPPGEITPPNSEQIAQQMKADAKAAAKAEAAKIEAKVDPKVEPKLEAKPEPKAEAALKAAEPIVEPQPAAKPEAARVEQPAAKPESAVAAKPAPEKPAAAVAAAPAAAATEPGMAVDIRRTNAGLRLQFPFATPVAAALFNRADTLWLVFDSPKLVDIEPVRRQGGSNIADISGLALPTGQAVRIRLSRPQLASLTGDAQGWTLTFADAVQSPSLPLKAVRNISDPARANVAVPLTTAGALHRIVDPDAGDTLLVVTAAPPARGIIKRQDFVEFALLESLHGVVVQPYSDDVTATVADDKVVVSRPGGLTLSSASFGGSDRDTARTRPIFDVNEWQKNQQGSFADKQDELINASAKASGEARTMARYELARFYMARGMYAEAKGVIDLVLGDLKSGQDDPIALIIRAACSVMIGHPEEALKDLGNPAIGANFDAQLWRALAVAKQGKWPEAREKLKNVEFITNGLPLDMQRVVLSEAMRASLEVKDYAGATNLSSELDHVGVPAESQPAVAVLRGRLDQALGRDGDALVKYRDAIVSPNRAASTEAKLLDLMLRQQRGEIQPADMLPELERLALTWRGDEIEVRAQQMMAKMYADLGRYREALAAARLATELLPNSQSARQAQDDASALFAQVFLSPKGDDMPPIDALAMFYDYRGLTPIGRRGDEMIRRLADRLVAVDLLDQAAELLQYQVDRRMEGAARAQVAARLAMVYLMNRKPDRAITALRSTRIADLSGELRSQRLLLEARAQSDIGRHDLALDIIANISGREAIRLRADIYWASRRWREASEQIELYLGDRWRDFKPLDAAEKSDVIRAVVGYALAEDALGLGRFREKFAPLMPGGADKIAFDIASTPSSGSNAEFSAIAKMAASVDTLDGFLREMKARFPDASARAILPQQKPSDTETTGALPEIAVRKIPLTR